MAATKSLLRACQSDDLKTLKQVIGKGNVNTKFNDDDTPLHIASARGHVSCCRVLLGQGAYINAQNCRGATPLRRASNNRHVACCKLLLENGASIDLQDNTGQTSLWGACYNGYDDCCKLLLGNGASFDIAPKNGATPLHVSAQEGHVGCCRILIDNGASVNNQNCEGVTPLRRASNKGHVDCCKLLLENGASIDVQDNAGQTALYAACYNGHVDCCKLLLENKASPDITPKNGASPLHVAAQEGNVGCCRILIDNGASINTKCCEGLTPLRRASNNGHVDCCIYLLENGALINMEDNTGRTSLWGACSNGHVECCKLLLQNWASVDIPNMNGFYPLHIASQEGHADCCGSLIENGASITALSKDGLTPLFLACKSGHIKCVEVLLEKSEELCLDDSVPIDIARSMGHFEIVRLLEEYKVKVSERNKRLKNLPKKGPNPSKSELKIDTCTNTKLCHLFIQSLELSDLYFNTQYDVCFCESCHRERGDNPYFTRGKPPKDYGLPIGWFKFGLVAPAKAAAERAFDEWHVAFHGTRAECVGQILKTADLLMPGDYTPEGARLKPPPNHFDDDNPAMTPPAGHDVSKIYLSPSIRYSGLEVYAPRSTYKDPTTGRMYNVQVAFQVRIRPGTYDVGDQTVGAKARIDPKFPNTELEWSTKRRGVTILGGLLVKIKEPMAAPSYRALGSPGPTVQQNLQL